MLDILQRIHHLNLAISKRGPLAGELAVYKPPDPILATCPVNPYQAMPPASDQTQ